MNLLSYLLLGVIAVWFVFAMIRIVRQKGNACGCGKSCGGDCAACGRCGKK